MKKSMFLALVLFVLSITSITIVYAEENDEAALLGTVYRGDLSIHLGDTPEQVHEVLGMPEEEMDRPAYMDSYPGLRVFYRDYTAAAAEYDWISSDKEEDYRVAMITLVPSEDPGTVLDPYTTSDGVAVYAIASTLKDIPSMYTLADPKSGEVYSYGKIYYDGEYYTYEDWQAKKQEIREAGDMSEYHKALMDVVWILYTKDKNKDQLKQIDVTDEMFGQRMR